MNHETFEHNGVKFGYVVHADDNQDMPWEQSEGCVELERFRREEEVPTSWRIAHRERGCIWAYDLTKWRKEAIEGRWGMSEEQREHYKRVRGKRPTGIAMYTEAMKLDVERSVRFLQGDWAYVGVEVFRLHPDGAPMRFARTSLWAIESDQTEYLAATVRELAEVVLSEHPVPTSAEEMLAA